MNKQKKIDWAELQKPVVLKADDWENNNYLLFKELRTAFDRIEEFTRIHSETGDDFEVPMNIGIFGERGSGKSSLLKSLKNKLEAEKYYVFDIIDPNTLSSDLNILEILITNVYQYIIHQNIEDPYLIERIISKLKRIMSALAIKRQKEDYLKKDNPSIDMLDKVNDIVKLDVLIIELLNEFKEILKKEKKYRELKDLVLIIDDLDLLDNKYIFKLISEIHEYLNTKLIIVFACRNQQLQDSILEEKIRSNKELMKLEKVDLEDIISQTEALLTKLIPIGNQIHLYTQIELLNKSYREVFDSLGIEVSVREDKNSEFTSLNQGSKTIEEWIYDRICYKTGLYLKPVDEKETVNLFLPNSLREFVQFLSIISLEDLKDKSTKTEKWENRIESIKVFKEYFLQKAYKILKKDEINLINNWFFVGSNQKNYLAFHYFLNKIEGYGGTAYGEKGYYNADYPFKLKLVENYNLRLGDVFEVMDLYKLFSAKTPIDFFVVYIFKVLYSFELIQLLINLAIKNTQSDSDEGSRILRQYLDIINTSFMPANFNYIEYRMQKDDNKYQMLYNGGDKLDGFIENFITSPIAGKGDIREGIYHRASSYRYRRMFYYQDIKRELMKGTTYDFDFFVLFVKTNYVEENIKQIINAESEGNSEIGFLLYSVFQIDSFVRINYANKQAGYDKYYGVIRKIQMIFEKINEGFKENDQNNRKVEEEGLKSLDEKYFYPIFSNKIEYKKPYAVTTDDYRTMDIEDESKNEKEYYLKLFKEANVIDEENFYIKTDGRPIAHTIYMPGLDGNIESHPFYPELPKGSDKKFQTKEVMEKVLEYKNFLDKPIRDLSQEIYETFLAKPKKQWTKRVENLFKNLTQELEDKYGAYDPTKGNDHKNSEEE